MTKETIMELETIALEERENNPDVFTLPEDEPTTVDESEPKLQEDDLY